MIANIALLAGISAAWAAGYLFVSDADHEVPPLTATATMALVAAIVLLVAVAAMRRPLAATLRRRAWVPMVMAFTAIVLPNLSVVLAERSIEANLAAVLGTTVPILTLVLTTFVTRQTPYSSWRLLGIGVALAGLVVFVGGHDLVSNDVEVLGMLTMMAGGLVFAVNGIFVSYQGRDLDEYALTTWTMIFGAGVLTAMALAFEAPLQDLQAADIWPLAAEGTIGMAVAYLGYFVLVARGGAYLASLYAFLVPPIGVIAAALAFGEPLTLRHVAGLVVVLAGLALMLRRGGEERRGVGLAPGATAGRRPDS
jgi:drug/metabolite transporter (DMT)-like permease